MICCVSLLVEPTWWPNHESNLDDPVWRGNISPTRVQKRIPMNMKSWEGPTKVVGGCKTKSRRRPCRMIPGMGESFGHHVSQKSTKSLSYPSTMLLQCNGGVTCDSPPLFPSFRRISGGRGLVRGPLGLGGRILPLMSPSDPLGLTAHQNLHSEEVIRSTNLGTKTHS
jgi:hypothetical protein